MSKASQYFKMGKSVLKMKVNQIVNNPFKKRDSSFPNRYIHIGYPKSASTAIQKGYLGWHNQLLHLGCGNREKKNYLDNHGYIDKDINLAMEIDLRYKTNLAYNGEKVKEVFEKYFTKAQENKYIHAVGISNENFCFNWHGGIDIVEKARRLLDLFSADTKIIIIIRRQKSLIESLYKENIRFGYAASFQQYLKYLWSYRDRNSTYELCFDKVINLYSDFFSSKNVCVLFFEDLKSNSEQFLIELSRSIGIDYNKLYLDKEYNVQLTDKELSIKKMLNEKYPHTFGKNRFEIVDTHRYLPHYINELENIVGEDVYEDLYSRKYLIKLAKDLSLKINAPAIPMTWDSIFGEKLLELYNESNRNLSKMNSKLNEKLVRHNYLNQNISE